MQKFVLEIIDEDYDDQGNVIYGKAVKPNAGWANLKDMLFNGGMMGAWPGVGSATQIDMGKLGTSTPLQFSYADGGYADNFGIAEVASITHVWAERSASRSNADALE